MDVQKLKENHKLLNKWNYDLGSIEKGYNNRTLYVNVSDNTIKSKPITQEMKDKFIGGKGFGLRYLWDAVSPNTKWNDPENEIIIGTGPICGITQYPGSGKSLIVSISPLTDIVIDSNVGGYFGPYLKFSGFDALELQGKAEKDVIIVLDGNNGTVQIEEAPLESHDAHILCEQLTEMYADDEKDKRNVAVVCAGSAAEHTLIGMLNFSFYDLRRKVPRIKQAGRGGIGTVFRDKHIKALVIKFKGVKGNLNHPAKIELLNKAGLRLHREIEKFDNDQCRMRQVGTANIIEVMDQYDLLPTHNFKYGAHKNTKNIESNVFRDKFLSQNLPDGCWYGCSMSCAKAADNFELLSGPYKGHKVTVDGPEYENAAGLGANMGCFDPQFVMEANFYCDTYGIDIISFATMTAFIMECYEAGILNKEITGGLDLKFGNSQDALKLLHQMSRGEGFGKIAGQGTHKMKQIFAKEFGGDLAFMEDIGMEQKGLEYSEYQSKESLAQQGGYGLTNKGPQHDEAWLIFMDMVNNQIPSFEDKAEALHYFPMFRTWFGLMGLCKLPWNDITPASNKNYEPQEAAKVPEHVENYRWIFEGVTGKPLSREELILQSERVYNFQRIFNIRLGKGLRKNDAVPYRAAGPVTEEEYLSRQDRYDKQLQELMNVDPAEKTTAEKIAIVRKYRLEQYEKLTDAVYKRRGWNSNGVPTIEHLKKIGMDLPELIEVIQPLQ
ncbi:aldehyde ferredoxin oxidoreductase family protein [Candidatus Lokiarchaeum ossiferum]|uniref:aldehyde ferredoxin oxidoreductase family protein n=1 Tax=Candidatus Lokiarchaeum ossiferum TaxID=2951803 RepID=UPI00352DA78D